MLITKSDFQTFRNCASDFWIKKHKPELIAKKEVSDFDKNLALQGYEVEKIVQLKFSEGIIIENINGSGIENTISAIDNGNTILFQPCFASNGLYTRVDMLIKKGDSWDLYEVKATSSKENKKEDQIIDVAFQSEVLASDGIKLNKLYLIELNKEYVKNGDIILDEILVISEITNEVNAKITEVASDIIYAKRFLSINTQPTTCNCIYTPRKNHCDSFSLFHNIPDYAIHDITYINRNKIAVLYDRGITLIEDVPEDFKLSTSQFNQVTTHKTKIPIIEIQKIKDELQLLEFPFYFLDYETVSTAIPVFNGTSPYQQVPFQYSLHVLHSDGTLNHFEFLQSTIDSPIDSIALSLKKNIGKIGSIISWNKSFESTVNKNIATRFSEHQSFLYNMNNRMYDLMDIFGKHQYYIHSDFKGKYSIKKVLPVLCPELSYEKLPVNNGGMASSIWKKMINDNISIEEKETIKTNLLEYCKLDTFAMVRIYQELKNLDSKHEVEIWNFEDYLEGKKLEEERNQKIKSNFNF